MATSWEKERKHALEGIGWHGWMARFSWILGVIFAIMGIIGDRVDGTIFLRWMSWFLLSIAAFASGIICMVAWLGGIYLHAKETEKQKTSLYQRIKDFFINLIKGSYSITGAVVSPLVEIQSTITITETLSPVKPTTRLSSASILKPFGVMPVSSRILAASVGEVTN